MKTIRLTMAQALVRHLAAQRIRTPAGSDSLFHGVFAIFGHGNVAGLGEALAASRETLPTFRAHNEQAMAHAAIAFAKANRRRRMMAFRLNEGEEIALDGVLDEPVWSRAIPAADFVQQDPQNGGPATEKTEVRIAFDSEAAAAKEALPPGFHEPMLSPDGTTIAGHYNDLAARGERVALVPVSGGAAKLFPTVPPNASWTPDGKALVYVDTRAGVSNILRQPIAGGTATPLTSFGSEQIFNYALMPDQRQLGAVRGRVSSDVVLISTGKR